MCNLLLWKNCYLYTYRGIVIHKHLVKSNISKRSVWVEDYYLTPTHLDQLVLLDFTSNVLQASLVFLVLLVFLFHWTSNLFNSPASTWLLMKQVSDSPSSSICSKRPNITSTVDLWCVNLNWFFITFIVFISLESITLSQIIVWP